MNYKKIKTLIIILFISFTFLNNVNAAGPTNDEDSPANQPENNLIMRGIKDVNETGYSTDINQNTLPKIIANIVRTVLSLLGIIFLILIIIAGYQWMTAGGNDEIIGKAKKRITSATIGLAIVILSYSISYFIMEILYKADGTIAT